MHLNRPKTKEIYLADTPIENIFINEYLPGAPGDYVKVYIYGYMYALLGENLSDKAMAEQLGITEAKLTEAWEYWQGMGVVKLVPGSSGRSVSFVNQKELLYGNQSSADSADTEPGESDILKEILEELERVLGRTLSTTELAGILAWINDEHIAPDVIIFAAEYSADRGIPNLNYISKVLHNWISEGLTTIKQVRERAEEMDERHRIYRRIMKALGFSNRNATEPEMKLMDSWIDDMGFNLEQILKAVDETSGIPTPNFKYVNSVLKNWKSKADSRGIDVNRVNKVSGQTLEDYYSYLRESAETAAEQRREEVYGKAPEIKQIEEELGQLNIKRIRLLLMKQDVSELERRMNSLEEEKAFLLTENGFDMNYMEPRFRCKICKDTGVAADGGRCSCVAERLQEAEIWQGTRG